MDQDAYEAFLRSIGYLMDEPGDSSISTDGVDPEIATLSRPQLVVPLLNARFAANAALRRSGGEWCLRRGGGWVGVEVSDDQ